MKHSEWSVSKGIGISISIAKQKYSYSCVQIQPQDASIGSVIKEPSIPLGESSLVGRKKTFS